LTAAAVSNANVSTLTAATSTDLDIEVEDLGPLDLVLLKDQTTSSENGLYIVKESGSTFNLEKVYDDLNTVTVVAGDAIFRLKQKDDGTLNIYEINKSLSSQEFNLSTGDITNGYINVSTSGDKIDSNKGFILNIIGGLKQQNGVDYTITTDSVNDEQFIVWSSTATPPSGTFGSTPSTGITGLSSGDTLELDAVVDSLVV
jgi:hypothetical protein